MAGTCAQCGAALAPTSESCTSCGAPLAAAPAQPVPQSAQPAKSSGGVAKIILVAAIAVVIGILAAGKLGFAGWRASQPGTANAKTNDALFSIPGIGSIATGSDATADPSQLGAPVYPGAVQDKGAVSVGLSAVAGAEAHFTTSDPVSQVVSFYTSNVTGAIVAATANGAVINAGPTAKDRVTVTITPGSGSNAGKTEIVIVRTAKS